MTNELKAPPWSYSIITLYDQCPKKYYHQRVAKDLPQDTSEHLVYGQDVHKACELYVERGTPIEPKYSFVKPYLDTLKARPGDKFVEHRIGLKISDGRLVACDFFDPDVWFRTVIDLLILNIGEAEIIDYKTGSNKYPDDLQLRLMASAVFIRFPKLKRIRAGLLFFRAPDFVKRIYTYDKRLEVFADLSAVLTQRETSYRTGVFNPKRNFTCKAWCPVMSCNFNGRR